MAVWLELNIWLPLLYAWGWCCENVGPYADALACGIAVLMAASVITRVTIGRSGKRWR